MAISDELPDSREGWPQEVLDAAALFACGDVVENPPFFYFADPRYGVLRRTKEYFDGAYAGPELLDAGEIGPPFGVLTSQTCDVGEIDFEPPIRPFISVAPVIDATDLLDGGQKKLLRSGKRIGTFLHLPKLSEAADGFWVADFRIELPVEKSWLVGKKPIKGFETEAQARVIPKVLNDIRSRPAWARVINVCVEESLRDTLGQLRQKNRAVYDLVVEQVEQIGVRADSMIEPSTAQLAAFTRAADVDPSAKAWWSEATEMIAGALEAEGITPLPSEIHDLNKCSVATYELYAPVTLGGRYSPQ
ncbi:MAG: hypothetical protein WCF12_08070 [Propionicimonas sp.]